MYTFINRYDITLNHQLANEGAQVYFDGGRYYSEGVILKEHTPKTDTKYYRYITSFANTKYVGLIVTVDGDDMRVRTDKYVGHNNKIEPFKINTGDLFYIINTLDCDFELNSNELSNKVYKVVGFDLKDDRILVKSDDKIYTVNPYNLQPLITKSIEPGDTVIVGNGRKVKVVGISPHVLTTTIGKFYTHECTLYKKPIKSSNDHKIDHRKKLPDLFTTNPNLQYSDSFVGNNIYKVNLVLFRGIFPDGNWACYMPYDMTTCEQISDKIGIPETVYHILKDKGIGGLPYHTKKFLEFRHKFLPISYLVKSKQAKKRKAITVILLDKKHKEEVEKLLPTDQYKTYNESENIKIYGIEFKHIKQFNKFLRIDNDTKKLRIPGNF